MYAIGKYCTTEKAVMTSVTNDHRNIINKRHTTLNHRIQ